MTDPVAGVMDPRAVRVSLASNRDVRIVVAPSPEAGQAVVDGEATTERLVRHDAVRATLEPAGATVLLLPSIRDPASGETRREVVVEGWSFEVALEYEARARLHERARRGSARATHDGRAEVRAIIPGRIVSVAVATGDAVELGTRVMVVEAMKMQNELRAPRAGTVGRIAIAAGQTVELGDLLLVIE